MKVLKLFYVAVVVSISSCAVHVGDFNCSTSIQNSNFLIIKPVYGFASANYFLGLGGLSKDRLVFDAKENLYANAKLQKNQVLANVVVDNRYLYLLPPLYIQHRVYLSADIVEFSTDGKFKSASVDSVKNSSNNSTDTSTIYTKDLQLIKIGSWVSFSDLFGLKYTGTVTRVFKKSVEVQYYTGVEGYNKTVVRIKKIKKIK